MRIIELECDIEATEDCKFSIGKIQANELETIQEIQYKT
jgi:hypothetical protein